MKIPFIKSIVFWAGLYVFSIGLQECFATTWLNGIDLCIAGVVIIYGRWIANKKLSL